LEKLDECLHTRYWHCILETGAKAGPTATSGQIKQTGTVGFDTIGLSMVGRRQGSIILQ
jgi:hypothetical protein